MHAAPACPLPAAARRRARAAPAAGRLRRLVLTLLLLAPPQVLRYGYSQEYKAHFDSLDDDSPRTATVLIYLSDVRGAAAAGPASSSALARRAWGEGACARAQSSADARGWSAPRLGAAPRPSSSSTCMQVEEGGETTFPDSEWLDPSLNEKLGPLSKCADVRRLRRGVPPPPAAMRPARTHRRGSARRRHPQTHTLTPPLPPRMRPSALPLHAIRATCR